MTLLVSDAHQKERSEQKQSPSSSPQIVRLPSGLGLRPGTTETTPGRYSSRYIAVSERRLTKGEAVEKKW